MPTAAPPDLDTLALRLKALSDPLRLKILDRLRGGEHCVCELTDALSQSQSLLSFHLKTLKDAGFVSDRRDGRWMHYALNPEAMRDVEALLRSLGRRRSGRSRAPVRCV